MFLQKNQVCGTITAFGKDYGPEKTTMKTVILLIFVLLFTIPAHAHESHEAVDVELLPLIPVTIVNDTDTFLSLTISNLCEPRIILKPHETITTIACFRHGIVYHTRAVFYNQREVFENHDFLFLAKPQTPWIFFKNITSQSQ